VQTSRISKKMKKEKINKRESMEDADEGFWEKGFFAETMDSKGMEERMKTFHKKHDEDMNFKCKKCSKKISAHNKDWHAGMCDDCFDKERVKNI